MGLCSHTHITTQEPFPPVQKIMSQHNSNNSTTHIISMGSKLFPSLKYTFHSIYSNTSPYTKHNLPNNLFKHTLGLGLCSHTHFTPPWPFLPVQKITSQHNSNYSTTHIISIRSKLFPSLKYTFHSIYSNNSPYTKHNLQNNLFKHTLHWVYVHIPILLPHNHFPLFKKLHYNTIQTIPLHILFQWDQNYFPHSNILSTQYIPTTVHTFNTIYKIIYLNTLWVGFMFTYPFYYGHFQLSKNFTTQFKLFHYTYYFNGSKLFPSLKYIFHSIYSNNSPYTKHKLQNNLFKHTLGWVYVHIPILLPHNHFPLFKKLHYNTIQTIPLHILFQWDQNYFPHSNILSTQYIPTTVHTLNTTYKIIYLNTLWVGFMFTYPFYSPTTISNCSKNYVTTQFKLFHYTYYFNGIKIISLTQIYFPLNIFQQQSIH